MTPSAQYWGLQVGLPGLGLALLVAGVAWEVPPLLDLGVLALAAGAVGSGLACAVYRRIVFVWPSEQRYRLVTWHGNAALCFGASLLALGAAVAAAGLAHLLGHSPESIRDAFLARPSLALIPAGLALFFLGVGTAVGFPEGRDPTHGRVWNLVLSIPSRLGGAILILLGAGVLAVGGYEFLKPEGFDAWVQTISQGWPW